MMMLCLQVSDFCSLFGNGLFQIVHSVTLSWHLCVSFTLLSTKLCKDGMCSHLALLTRAASLVALWPFTPLAPFTVNCCSQEKSPHLAFTRHENEVWVFLFLRHGSVLQVAVSVLSPRQSVPSLIASVSTSLVLCLDPTPQVELQVGHSVQIDQTHGQGCSLNLYEMFQYNCWPFCSNRIRFRIAYNFQYLSLQLTVSAINVEQCCPCPSSWDNYPQMEKLCFG